MEDGKQELTAARLAEFCEDVESLKRRNQRFAQMLVEDFELLIAAADSVHARLLDLQLENKRLKSLVESWQNIQEKGAHIGYGTAITREIERLQTERDRFRAALQCLYEETVDYIRINHLGDAHHNRSMQMACSALCRDGATTNDLPTPTPPPPTQPAT